ncbi:ABC transporter permease subunit [Paenibacillus sp. LMG 31458]|uniref:ABC transporter permease subunit n=2 Tax=Paenibacillus TaxID=44249 RepID=A0ABX1Z642_9BACL|nr:MULTISPECIES: carbohydrate ABC transporter permease [Paenibacillus]NOU75278.1 ABC transporter permease subunit [Paenibacillus phytorum]NOU88289.1 ABC transporter permease subunit [Paenibacillus germinis]
MKSNTINKWSLMDCLIYGSLILFSLLTIVPFVLAVVVSFSSEKSVLMNGYQFFPDAFSLSAYKVIFMDGVVFKAYSITIFVTVVGTIFSLIVSTLLGYSISIPKVRYRNIIAVIIFIPIIFSAGLVPWYLNLTKVLHLRNTILAYILPLAVSPFNIFLLRNYYKTIPTALSESAEIDGAGPWYVFFKIITPLSGPILATIGLFVSLAYWNDFIMPLWLIDDRSLFSVQFLLYRINSMIQFMSMNTNIATVELPSETLVFAMFLVAIGPIILVYPYVQKYFVKGIMIGSVKG